MTNIKRSRTSKKLVNNKRVPFTFNKSIPSSLRYKNVNNNAESKKYKKNCACVTCQQRSTEANSAIIYFSDDIDTVEKFKTWLENNGLYRKRLLIKRFEFNPISWSITTNTGEHARINNPLRYDSTFFHDLTLLSEKCYINGPLYLTNQINNNIDNVTATATGNVEWAYIKEDINNKKWSLLIDHRVFTGTIEGKDIKYGELLDIYDGKLTWFETDIYWHTYYMDDLSYDITENINNSAFQSRIRIDNQDWGRDVFLRIDISVTNSALVDNIYTPHDTYSKFILDAYEPSPLNRHRILVNYQVFEDTSFDTRQFYKINLLNGLYDGPITGGATDTTTRWIIYYIQGDITSKIKNFDFSAVNGTKNEDKLIIEEINNSSHCKVSDYRNPIIGYRKSHCLKKEKLVSLDTIYQDIHAKSCFDGSGNCLKGVYYYNRPRSIINKGGYFNETYNYSTNQYLTRRCNTIKQRESVIFDKKVSKNTYVSSMNCDYDASNNVICKPNGFNIKLNNTPCNINKAKCYSIYKRSNRKFNTQGAVSGGSRVQRLKRLNQKYKQKQGLKYKFF